MKKHSHLVIVALSLAVSSCTNSTSSTPATAPPASAASPSSQVLSTQPAATPAPTTAVPRLLRVLVTNDDGFDAPGIDAIVQYLRTVPNVEVSVVAPATNQSGSGDKSTPGASLVVADVKTLSGYPAKSVAGFPADSVLWAINGGLATKPDLVVSGSNLGQNYGPLNTISGTVGAAATAARAGIPAIAISQGVAVAPAVPYFPASVTVLSGYFADKLATYRNGSPSLLTVINVPTCPDTATLFPTLVAPAATDAKGRSLGAPAPCDGPLTGPATDDIDAFNAGHGVVSYLDPATLAPITP